MDNKNIKKKENYRALYQREFPDFSHEYDKLIQDQTFCDMLSELSFCERKLASLSGIVETKASYYQLVEELRLEIKNHIIKHANK